ncbi:protein-disulfide reductase DsbD family protein [Mangrovibacterium diazotrophicum]|uniref:Thiol:disulfide interchange protein DsbD n=1 Tax=Mangrovibacterium diazotrophicum TaxID=1261403 RepID=A0A419W6E1_9BACT|nr:thioredoxin family protein [Mangrovibacterium diazotrophicum]RKD91016.1 thiol:disulfide interchange protein DsbD [Mangrovibacterium diazotrophicum]
MKKFSALILLALIALQSFAQIQEPVKWSFDSKQNGDEVQLIFKATIDEGWHLYDTQLPEGGPVPTSFHFNDNSQIEFVGKMTTNPAPIDKFDDTFQMELRYFGKKAEFIQVVKLKTTEPVTIDGYLEFMCCNDETCLPPTEVDFSFKTKAYTATEKEAAKPAVKETAVPEKKKEVTEVVETTSGEVSEAVTETTDDSAAGAVASTIDIAEKVESTPAAEGKVLTDKGKEGSAENLWMFLFFSFLAGLAAILTPCVFPMIPMTVSFFMHSGDTKAKSRMYAIFYGISIIAIYTIVGTVVALIFGPDIANWLSTHWIPNIIFFLVFMIFAFSFFGMFEIVLPSWLVNKSDSQVDKGGFMGSFFMALTLVLVSFSCTGPIVGAILVQSAGGAVLKPIVGMFGFSMAFALPFTLFALFPGWLNSLPKSGGWLNSVKVVLGFLELALGLKFLSVADQTYHWGILDREVYLAIWIVIFTLLGFYLLGKLKFSHDSDVKHVTVPRLMLSIASFAFVIYLIPGMFGAPLKAISGYMPPMSTHDFDLRTVVREEIKLSGGAGNGKVTGLDVKPKYREFLHLPHGLEGFFDYEEGMAYAKKVNKPVFIDFTGHGCVNCREMEANVWSDPRVLQRMMNDYVIIALYVDDKKELPEGEWVTSSYDGRVKKTIGKKYADFQITRFGVNAQPYYVLLDHAGKELTEPKAYDLNADNFVKFLDEGLANFKAQAN